MYYTTTTVEFMANTPYRVRRQPTKPSLKRTPSFHALELFKQAAHRVPAYKDFLRKNKIDPDTICTEKDFLSIPPINKENYIRAYPLKELSWDGTLSQATYISSSSGSTGIPFYWPRGNIQNDAAGEIFRNINENIFDTKKESTLFVNLFALGTWIAGLEFYNAAKFVSDSGNDLTILTPGIEKNVAVDAIKKLAPSFTKIILAGYPPFIKDVLEYGAQEGIDWKKYDVRLCTAGEPFSELWRDRVLETIGRVGSFSTLINVYGMAEVGIVGHETPHSIFLRRSASTIPTLKQLFSHEGNIAALYQYDPLARYFEVGEKNTLMLTANAGLPLIRYNTRDQGGLIQQHELQTVLDPEQQRALKSTTKSSWDLPYVYLHGRRDLSLTFYALNVYVENIKHCLESFKGAHELSGLFIMRVGHTKNMDQQFELLVELGHKTTPVHTTPKALVKHVTQTLQTINTEYAKLYSVLGTAAAPKVVVVVYGDLDTIPGRKHRWVKRA